MAIPGLENPPTKNPKLLSWVAEVAELTQPDKVEWCDSIDAEWDRLTSEMVESGTFIRLNPEKAELLPRPTPTRPTWPGWRIAPTSAPSAR